MGARTEGRRAAVCMLYQAELAGDTIDAVMAAVLDGGLLDDPIASDSRAFAEYLARGVDARRGELDRMISEGSAHWRLERMAAVDRNVLRLALFELVDDPETPAAVILNEAVELAKLFGGDESAAFVNGVVDGIRKQLEEGRLIRGTPEGGAGIE